MHSKIIIASFICALAASFGNFKSETTFRSIKPITEETKFCNAPNEHHASIYVSNERGNIAAGGWFEIITDIPIRNKAWNTITERDDPYSLLEGYFSYCGDLGVTINIPENNGIYHIGFGIDGGEVAKVFIYVKDGLATISTLSKGDARAKYFIDYVATSAEKNILRGYSSGFSKEEIFDTELKYGDFVNGRNDIKTSITYVNNNASLLTQMITKPSVDINIHATWYDKNGVSHPLVGIKTDVITPQGTSLDPHSALINGEETDETGDCRVKINFENAIKIQLSQLKLRLTATNDAVTVDDDYSVDYKYCFALGKAMPRVPVTYASKCLNNFTEINYNIVFYCGESDRANAFEIAKAERLPYVYCNDFTDGVSSIRVHYPSMNTHYSNNAGEGRAIRVRYDDFENWDVLNHEYGHHICDSLEICFVPGLYKAHDINENLAQRYGTGDGFYLACSEGLATFIGIASQLYKPNEINVPGVGDMRYDDPLRNVAVDYSQRTAGFGYFSTNAKFYECSIASVLLKILTDEDAHVSDSSIWKVLGEARFDDCDYSCFFDQILDVSYGGYDAICQILLSERFSLPHDFSEWTIMIYMNGQNDLEDCMADDVKEILNAGINPSDVNILIQANESYKWPEGSIFYNRNAGRYHVEKGNLVLDELLPEGTDAENVKTFESFLLWGLSKYPAKKTGLVLSSHSAKTFKVSGLTNLQVWRAIDNAFEKHGIKDKLEFIAYDSCLMQVQDVADFASDHFKYMVGSEESVAGDGLKYDEWIKKVYDNCGTNIILKEMAFSYVNYLTRGGLKQNQTMSVLDLRRMQEYREAFEHLADMLYDYVALPLSMDGHDDYSSLGSAIRQSKYFEKYYETHSKIDGLDFLRHLRDNKYITTFIGTDVIDNVISLYESVVYYNFTGSDVAGLANGMSIHAPYCRMTQYTSEIKEGEWDSININDVYPLNSTNFKSWRKVFKTAFKQKNDELAS